MSKIIRIAARRDGFRRAGIAHPAASTDYPAERFTDAQLKQLLDEPQLIVTVLDAPEEKPAEGAAKSGKNAGAEKK